MAWNMVSITTVTSLENAGYFFFSLPVSSNYKKLLIQAEILYRLLLLNAAILSGLNYCRSCAFYQSQWVHMSISTVVFVKCYLLGGIHFIWVLGFFFLPLLPHKSLSMRCKHPIWRQVCQTIYMLSRCGVLCKSLSTSRSFFDEGCIIYWLCRMPLGDILLLCFSAE